MPKQISAFKDSDEYFEYLDDLELRQSIQREKTRNFDDFVYRRLPAAITGIAIIHFLVMKLGGF
jgi:hypothetical protein